MSADNWTKCPKCGPDDGICGTDNPDTLREDFSIGTDGNGSFEVSYRCRCDRCGFRHNFKYKEDLMSRPGNARARSAGGAQEESKQ